MKNHSIHSCAVASFAVALFCIPAASHATATQAQLTLVPAGLVAGDTYRLVFVTADIYTATDPKIADYNAEVTAEADSVSALLALGTTWSVIGSTSAVNAIDNIGQDAAVPIYNLESNLIANDATTNTGGLFSTTGDLSVSLFNPIQYTETGGFLGSANVFTGTAFNGTANINYPGRVLGGASIGGTSVFGGNTADDNANWIYATSIPTSSEDSLYAISGVITVAPAVVPEPSTWAALLSGIGMLGCMQFVRRTRRA